MARMLEGSAASMKLMAIKSASQLNYVWDLLNMSSDDKTKLALESKFEIKISQFSIDNTR